MGIKITAQVHGDYWSDFFYASFYPIIFFLISMLINV